MYKMEAKLMLRIIGFLLFLMTLLSAGCATPRATKVPMDTVLYAQPDAIHQTLLIFLPGIRGDGTEYARKGFVQAVRTRNLPVDLLAADAHFGYYAERNLIERLRADVIAPAKAEGYKNIWFVGTSLGGFGSLLYSSQYPDDITGMVVLAPYLGSADVIAEISAAGGLKRWQPGSSVQTDAERRLWAWLKNYAVPDNGLPPLYLGYGRDDKFAAADALLASVLPPRHVDIVSGGHNWSTWKTLWDRMLDAEFLNVSARRYGRQARNYCGAPPLSPRGQSREFFASLLEGP
jgi:pimeloyl-ACP methyl ester carboxylesterase